MIDQYTMQVDLWIVQKNNYTRIENETLVMIYTVKKFKHYFLGNYFILFVNHQALYYLVNKPTITSWIAKWLLLLQEFDFKVVYKPSQVHFLLNHLSKINHGESTERVDDQLLDVHLFNVRELIGMVQS